MIVVKYHRGSARLLRTKYGKVAVSWLKILAANPNPNTNHTILSHETAT